MQPHRRTTPFFILIALALLLTAASSPNPQARWVIEAVDAPMLLENLTPSMLKVVDGISYVAFGGDHLYYAYYDPDLADWVTTTVDDSPGVGAYASLAKNGTDHPFISYYDSLNKTLKFATSKLFQGWYIETIDSTPGSGIGSSIVTLTGGQQYISYLTGTTLKYIEGACAIISLPPHVSCSWDTPKVVDTNINSIGTSIATTSTGIPHIAYVTNTGYLKHAYKIGGGAGNCGDGNNWKCETLSSSGVLGTPSIALWGTLPRIIYDDSTSGLMYLSFTGTVWNGSTPHGGDLNYGLDPSLVLDTSGIPYISYRGNTAVTGGAVWHASGTVAGGPWTREAVQENAFAGQTAIAFDQSPSGYPCIMYYYHYQDWASLVHTCKPDSWTSRRIMADSRNVGQYTSLSLDANGVPFIAYQDRLDQAGIAKSATWSTTPGNCWGSDGTGLWKCGTVNEMDINFGNGYMNSIAINPLTGLPAISYLDRTGVEGLGYAWYVGIGGHCTDNGAWDCTIIYSDPDELPGYDSSLAFTSSGVPVIAFSIGSDDRYLGLARYVGYGGNCPTNDDWDCEGIEYPIGASGGQPSLTLTSTGRAVVSYNNNTDQMLKVAIEVPGGGGTGCNGPYAENWDCLSVTSDIGDGIAHSSIALISDTQAYISFYHPGDDALALAWIDLLSGMGTSSIVAGPSVGQFNSIAIYQGIPWIAYSDSLDNHSLHLAHYVVPPAGNCGEFGAFQCDIIDAEGSVGLYPSLKINSAGMAYISYYDDANGDLKLAYTRLFGFLPLIKRP
jgi:hypothetical protein